MREKRRKEREAAKKLKKEQMGENYVSEDEEEEEEEEGEGESKGESNVGKEKIAEESSKGEVSGLSSILAVIPEQNSDRFWVSMVSSHQHAIKGVCIRFDAPSLVGRQ